MSNQSGKTKYYILMEELKADIRAGKIKPGDRLPSENQLVLQYKVSRHTVRKALAILESDGYVMAEHGRGTFCSERVRHMQSSKNIAVITTYISDYIFPRLIQGMDRVLSANGYSIVLKNTGNSRKMEAQALEDILRKDVDGLIIEPSKSQLVCKHPNLYQMLDEYQIPYVFIQGIYEQMEDKPHILMDDVQGGYLVTQHLVELGHRHIVGIFKADDIQGKGRHKGYVKALQDAGMQYDPDMVVWFHTEDRKEKPTAAIMQMLKKGIDIDGIVCYNDQIAMGVYEAISGTGRSIPKDISLTGYDNSAYTNSQISLTTIAHPQEKLGEMAAQLLLEKIQKIPDEESQVECLIKPELIIRNSCCKRTCQ